MSCAVYYTYVLSTQSKRRIIVLSYTPDMLLLLSLGCSPRLPWFSWIHVLLWSSVLGPSSSRHPHTALSSGQQEFISPPFVLQHFCYFLNLVHCQMIIGNILFYIIFICFVPIIYAISVVFICFRFFKILPPYIPAQPFSPIIESLNSPSYVYDSTVCKT